jgi:hypothetical protein
MSRALALFFDPFCLRERALCLRRRMRCTLHELWVVGLAAVALARNVSEPDVDAYNIILRYDVGRLWRGDAIVDEQCRTADRCQQAGARDLS